MDEGERVLERLERIELLGRERAPAEVVLDEMRALLADAEDWVRSEARENERSRAAVEGLRQALERRAEPVLAPERTLVA